MTKQFPLLIKPALIALPAKGDLGTKKESA
jgi:hypothetical protein